MALWWVGALAFGPFNNDGPAKSTYSGPTKSTYSSGESSCGGDGTLCWIGLPIDGDFSKYKPGSAECGCVTDVKTGNIECDLRTPAKPEEPHINKCWFAANKNPRLFLNKKKPQVGKYLRKCQKCACQHGPDSQEFKDAKCNEAIPEDKGGPTECPAEGCEEGCVNPTTAKTAHLPLDGNWDGKWDCDDHFDPQFRCASMKSARGFVARGLWGKYLKKCQRCRCKKVKGKTGDWNNFKRGKCNEPVTCNKK